MPYNKSGFTPASIDDITDFYRQQVNGTLFTDYDSTSFAGTNLWKMFQAPILKDKENENFISYLFEVFKTKVDDIQSSIVSSEAGLVSGIYAIIKSLDEVNDVSIYNPTDNGEWAGRIGIAVEYNDASKEKDGNTNQTIANTIANNIGAGIHMDSTDFDYSVSGIISANGQVITTYWKKAVLVPIYLQIKYRTNPSVMMPDITEIKKTLLDLINNNYKFGNRFTTTMFTGICNFEYFRFMDLEWSLDGKTYKADETTPKYWEKWTFSEDKITITETE